ncbi:hypothetical protein D3C86_1643700 [compost metagenome]
MEHRDDGEGDREGDGVGERLWDPEGIEAGRDQRGDGGFAERTEGERGERDTQLTGGEVGVEVLGDVLCDAGLGVSFGDELLETARPDLDHGELCGNEEPV